MSNRPAGARRLSSSSLPPAARLGRRSSSSSSLGSSSRASFYSDGNSCASNSNGSSSGSRRPSLICDALSSLDTPGMEEDVRSNPAVLHSMTQESLASPHHRRPFLRRFRRRCWRKCRYVLQSIVGSGIFSTFMFLLTIYVLFSDDLRLAFFGPEDDGAFNVITILCLVIFSLEIVIASIALDDYFLSFFFGLDLMATSSLVLDLQDVSTFLIASSVSSPEDMHGGTQQGVAEHYEYARAGRSSRVGGRLARILRVVRLIRIMRIFKFWFASLKFSSRRCNVDDADASEAGDESDALGENGGDEFEDDLGASSVESRVGRRLSERTTISVIFLVLAMLIVIPYLDWGELSEKMFFSVSYISPLYSATVIHQAWLDYKHANATSGVGSALVAHRRYEWERQVLQAIYYHNYHYHAEAELDQLALYRLFFVGYIMPEGSSIGGEPYLPLHQLETLQDSDYLWSSMFSGTASADDASDSRHKGHGLEPELRSKLEEPWVTTCEYQEATIVGVSLLEWAPCPWQAFRLQDTVWYVPPLLAVDSTEGRLVLFFDVRLEVRWQATLNLVQTAFIICVLTVAAILFGRDIDRLVLHPIERMIVNVDLIRKNPLYAITLSEGSQYHRKQKQAWSPWPTIRRRFSLVGENSPPPEEQRRLAPQEPEQKSRVSETLETKILENLILKLGSLLALGFGEAGSEIIGRNLAGDGMAVDPMIPGSRVEAIYGVCKIREFTTLTEVLQEKTMVFVNRVASIVHRIVDDHLGAANKNLGEAFMLVWRVRTKDQDMRAWIADLSLIAFVQVAARVHQDAELAKYPEHPVLVSRLGRGYRVRLAYGLHFGWSIEGAIGSEFKIDASYLSSHVNMSHCLEAETARYGVGILLSEAVVRTCTVSVARLLRPVDRVRVGGVKAPIRFFTADLDPEALATMTGHRPWTPLPPKAAGDAAERERLRFQLQSQYKAHCDRDVSWLRSMVRASHRKEFFQTFEKGFLNYEAGEWDIAARSFNQTLQIPFGSRETTCQACGASLDACPGSSSSLPSPRPSLSATAAAAAAAGAAVPAAAAAPPTPASGALCKCGARKPECTYMEDGPSVALLNYMKSFAFQAPENWRGFRDLSVEVDTRSCSRRGSYRAIHYFVPRSARCSVGSARSASFPPYPGSRQRSLSNAGFQI